MAEAAQRNSNGIDAVQKKNGGLNVRKVVMVAGLAAATGGAGLAAAEGGLAAGAADAAAVDAAGAEALGAEEAAGAGAQDAGGAGTGQGGAANAAENKLASKAMSSLSENLEGVDPQQVVNAANKAASGDISGAAKDIKKGFMQWVVREGFWYIAALDISIIFIPLIVLGLDIIWAFGKWQKVELTGIQKIVLAALNAILLIVFIIAFALMLIVICNSPAGVIERIYAIVVDFFGSNYQSICKHLQPI